MSKYLLGTVTKAVGGVFTVVGDKKYICFAPKKLRFFDGNILVGDKVKFSSLSAGKGLIEEVLERKNSLIRPEVANVDYLFVILAPLPQPDLTLIDKLIVAANKAKIIPLLVVNKSDIAEQSFVDEIVAQYKNVADTLVISTVTLDGVDKILEVINGHTVCLAGQSAVGKTSLLNCIIPNLNKEIGDLSQKTQRGMHTTRHSQIFPAAGGFVVDTTGFSLLELTDGILSRELMLYYDDMQVFSRNCKYNMCTHIAEPSCGVKDAVEKAEYSNKRYERYVEIFNQLQQAEKEKYN